MAYYTPLSVLVWMTLVVLCILAKENDRLTKKEKNILYFSYLIVGVAAMAEWLGVQLNGNMSVSPWIIRVVKLFDYILTPLAGGAMILQFRAKNLVGKLIFGALAVNMAFQFVSFFTGWMIVIDEANRYSHGPGYFLYIALYFVVVLLVIIQFALYGRKFRRQNRISLFAALVFTVTGVAFQEIFGGEVRTAYVSITICLALLFIHNSEFALLESDDMIHEQMVQISIDPMTGISSRYAYTEAINSLNEGGSLPDDLAVFSIDLNGLKPVNDTFGHSAGDELIRAASDCISAVFSHSGKCFRTGGDEFIVFAHADRDEVDELTERLGRKAAGWRGKEVRSLSLAVGHALAADYPGVPIEKLVSFADREMYRAKAEYYRANGIERRAEGGKTDNV